MAVLRMYTGGSSFALNSSQNLQRNWSRFFEKRYAQKYETFCTCL